MQNSETSIPVSLLRGRNGDDGATTVRQSRQRSGEHGAKDQIRKDPVRQERTAAWVEHFDLERRCAH
jgi:hypothetical protein